MQRIPANSQSLKERFPEVYREFFSRCHTVVSVPGEIFLVGEITGFYGGLCLVQKIPPRVYIGISESRTKDTVVNNQYYCFLPSKQEFGNSRADNLADSLNYILNKNSYDFSSKPCNVHFLSEYPITSSLISSSFVIASVAITLAVYDNIVFPEQIDRWSEKTVEELKNNSQLGFSDLFIKIWNFVEIVRDAYSSGVSAFDALVRSIYPLVYFSDKKDWHGWRLDELIPLPKTPYWPIDFGLIHTGSTSKPDKGIIGYKKRQPGIYDITNNIRMSIKEKLPYQSFLTQKAIKSKKSFWLEYMQMFNILSLSTFHSLSNIISNHISKEEFHLLFSSLNQYQNLFNLLGMTNSVINTTCFELHQGANRIDNEIGAGIKTSGIERENDVIFIVPTASLFISEIDKIIDLLRDKFGSEITLDYASWLDGYETEGIKIEQSLEHGIYSEFISDNVIEVRVISGINNHRSLLISQEEFDQEKEKIDLIFDERKNKIYICGRELSSDKIHSKKFTISLFKILLNSAKGEINSQQLPDSSYQNSRYELQGKIIDPLKHALLLSNHKDLNLRIQGGVADFSLKFLPTDLKIWFIENR